MENNFDNKVELSNIHNEILLIGSIYKDPNLYVQHGRNIVSKYDFSDKACQFLYEMFELMYKTFTTTPTEHKINTFMSEKESRLSWYRKIGGYKTIKQWIDLADTNDFMNYYDIVKKYSLLREYNRKGYNVDRIVNYDNFDKLKARDMYRIIRADADRVYTNILADSQSIDLTNENTSTIESFLIKPQMGLSFPFEHINSMFRGGRLSKMYVLGYLSNEGKTRVSMLIIAYYALFHKEPCLLMSNEMDENDLRSCLITTVLNYKEFQKLHGIEIEKNEEEIVLGLYRDDNTKEFITRNIDENGRFVETDEEYIKRVYDNSEEYRKVQEVGKWIDSHRNKTIFFKDVGDDYSDQRLEFEIRNHNIIYGINRFFYDTLKGYSSDNWELVKQTATKLKELIKPLNVMLWAVIQLTDDSVFTDIFQFSSNNIANAKQMKHVLDHLILGKKIPKDEYHKYRYLEHSNSFGTQVPEALNLNKTYYAWKVDKNRSGSKSVIPLFEVDLNKNTWYEVGELVKP